MQKQTGDDFSDKLQLFFQTKEVNFNQANTHAGLKPGSRCPECKTGILDYDGTLNLMCKQCNAVASTGGACT
jgi:hypothetical protein